MSSQTVAIVGATGNQGGSVLKTFASSGKYKVRALTRNPSSETVIKLKAKYPGVEWVKADLNDIVSLRKAFSGANAVFGVTQSVDPDLVSKIAAGNTEAEFNQGKNIIDAAIAEGVQVAIMSTVQSLAEASNGKYTKVLRFENKYKIAQYLDSKADQIKGVNLYLGFFLDNYVNYSRVSPEDGKTVEFTIPMNPATKVAIVDTVNDTGPAAKYALENADKYQGKPIVVAGGVYEVQYAIEAFTEATGKPARYVQIPYEVLGTDELIQMFQFMNDYGYFLDFDQKQNKKLDHHFATPVEFWKKRKWSGPYS